MASQCKSNDSMQLFIATRDDINECWPLDIYLDEAAMGFPGVNQVTVTATDSKIYGIWLRGDPMKNIFDAEVFDVGNKTFYRIVAYDFDTNDEKMIEVSVFPN